MLNLERRGHAVWRRILAHDSEVSTTQMLLRRLAALILVLERLGRVRGAQWLILDLVLDIADGREVGAVLMVRGRLQLLHHSALLLLEVVLLGLMVLRKTRGQCTHSTRGCLPRSLAKLMLGNRLATMAHLRRRAILHIVLHFQNQKL